jgi:ammonium transporter, Amt family
VAGALFVFMFHVETEEWKIDDVLGVWPLHGVCGTWGGIAAGIFGSEALGGKGGVNFFSQLLVTLGVILFTLTVSTAVYGILKLTVGIRMDGHEERIGSDLTTHLIQANPEEAL